MYPNHRRRRHLIKVYPVIGASRIEKSLPEPSATPRSPAHPASRHLVNDRG